MIDKDQKYTIPEALKLAKEYSKEKFDPTLEVHLNLGIDITKVEQAIRTTVSLPHGTGKSVKVAVFASEKVEGADIQLTEENLTEIQKGKLKPGVDFDIVVTEPAHMAKIARLGKILGPVGAMPNPKTGTVTTDVQTAVDEIKKGRMEIRTEQKAPVLHTVFGKLSFGEEKLEDNLNYLLKELRALRPQKVNPDAYIVSAFISTSMGPGIQLEI